LPFGPLYRALLGEAQHDAANADLSPAMDVRSGRLYYRFLVTQEPITHGYADRVLETLFAGLRPRP